MQRSCSKPSRQYGFTTFFLPFFFLNRAIPRCYSKTSENRVHQFEKNKTTKKQQQQQQQNKQSWMESEKINRSC